MVDMAHFSGLVAGKGYPNPCDYAHVVTSTTHKVFRSARGGIILSNEEDLGKKFDTAVFPGYQGGPLMHIIAAKAVCFKEAMEPEFLDYQKQILANAKKLSASLMEKDIDIVSNGTSNHMFLVNLVKNNLTGKTLDAALGSAHITVNKNSVPNDPQSPFVTSGIRIGTPAVTRRGFKENEMDMIASWIADIINDVDSKKLIDQTKDEVRNLCTQFPVYSR